MSQNPSSKPREDPPASGPHPEVQAPGDSSSEQHPPRLCEGAPWRVTFSDGDPGDEQAPRTVSGEALGVGRWVHIPLGIAFGERLASPGPLVASMGGRLIPVEVTDDCVTYGWQNDADVEGAPV